MTKQQFKQKQHHDAHVCERTFTLNDDVFVKNFASAGPNWLSGKIVAAKGPVSYDIQLKNGKVVHRHLDHIRTSFPMPAKEPEDDSDNVNITLLVEPVDEPETATDGAEDPPLPRKSKRTIRPPQCYGEQST